MNCGDMEPLLSAYYDGEATAEERKFVEDCLESSPDANAQLRAYRRITGEFEALPRPTPPADLRRIVLNQVHKISSANPARYANAPTERYRSQPRSATGSVRQPITVASVLSQGLKLGALLAVLVALLIAFTLVYNQFNKNQTNQTASSVTQTEVALAITNTPTPMPTSTPLPALETSTPTNLNGGPTFTPAPSDTPSSGATIVAQSGPTDTSAPLAPTDTTAPLPPTHIIALPLPTNTNASAPPTDTTAPAAKPSDTPIVAAPTTRQDTATPAAPTDTVEPPTATPVPLTATPYLTATPTPSPAPACAITPIRGFGKLYNEHSEVQAAMGCATDTEQAITGTNLLFQNGTMIWDSNHRLIYVFYNNRNGRSFEVYPENWDASQGEPTPVVQPTDGTYTPVRGFGKVWFNHQMWETLGFAKQQYETVIGEVVENFKGGRMLWMDQKLIYVMAGKLTPSSGASAVQFSGNWNEYRDTFVDGAVTPTPAAALPDDNATNNPSPDMKKAGQQ